MKNFFKILFVTSAVLLGIMAMAAHAAPTSTIVQNLFITQLAGNGTKCLQITNAGLVQTSTSACGTGSSGGSGIVTSSQGSYTPGNVVFIIDSSTISASDFISLSSSTGAFNFTVKNASGTFTYSIKNDGNYLEINNTTSSIPGTSPIPYNIILQNCPPVSTTSPLLSSSSWECALSQAENFPDGSRSFVDWDTEYYPTGTSPNTASGWFDNSRGTSSILIPYVLSWNDGSVNHVGFTEFPTVSTSATQLDAQFNLGTNGKFFIGTATNTTGSFIVNQNGASTCAGIYDSSANTIYGIADSLPLPSGCTGLGGYFKGIAVGGSTTGGSNPIFGVLNSSQSSAGRGHTAFTVYDTNEIDTFNNELDDGAGNAFVSSTLQIFKLTSTTNLRVSQTSTFLGAISSTPTNAFAYWNASGILTTTSTPGTGNGNGTLTTSTPFVTNGIVYTTNGAGSAVNATNSFIMLGNGTVSGTAGIFQSSTLSNVTLPGISNKFLATNSAGLVIATNTPTGSSGVQIPTITVSSQTGANFANNQLAAAVNSCANLGTYPNGAYISVPDSSYTVTTTLLLASECQIIGSAFYTTINFSATSTATRNSPGSALFAASGTFSQYAGFSNLILNQTSGTYSGTAWNMSNMEHSVVNNIKSQVFMYSIYTRDTANATFYNNVTNWTGFDDNGFYASSTNPVNENNFYNDHFFPNQSGSGCSTGVNACYGIFINNGQNNHFYDGHSEPATQAHTTGIYLTSNLTEDNEFFGSYIESNASSVDVENGAERNTFYGGEWLTPLTSKQNFTDKGVDTQVFGADNQGGGSINQFSISASSTFVDNSSNSQGEKFINNTSFAHTGGTPLVTVQLLNGTDSDTDLAVNNAGTGQTIKATNGTTNEFSTSATTTQITGNFGINGSSTFTTPALGGTLLAAIGACSSVTSTIDSSLSTTSRFITTPNTLINLGSFDWTTEFLSSKIAITYICAIVAGTPTSTAYTVTAIK